MKTVDDVIRYDLVWYRRLWRWLFPPKQLTFVEFREARNQLVKAAKKGDKIIFTTMGNFKLRKNGRVTLMIDVGKNREYQRATPIL